MEISEAKILITGGGRGIGNFVATNLVGKAAKIFVIDQDLELLNQLPKLENLKAFQADITDPIIVERTIKEIFEVHGGINVCINNAGVIHSEPLVSSLRNASN